MIGETNALPVAAIQKGTVIDHIKIGAALPIVKFLKLAQHKKPVTLGLNLPSQLLGAKDLIKVVGYELSPQERDCIAIFSPKVTINMIEDFTVVEKFAPKVPETVEGIIQCPNSRCISNHQKHIKSFLTVHHRIKHQIQLQCRFCRQSFNAGFGTDFQPFFPLLNLPIAGNRC
ncbi:MAG: aspartate carbamoyltransferase regulatory subunit [Waddliaceae bacterium]